MSFAYCIKSLSILVLIIYCSRAESSAKRHRRLNTGSTTQNSGPVSITKNNPQQSAVYGNPPKPAAPSSQVDHLRSRGYYNNPAIHPSPFGAAKPDGWFGTNQVDWVSNQYTELDKYKLAAINSAPSNSPQVNIIPPRDDGGPQFLENLAKEYASKGEKAFAISSLETLGGFGSLCTNHDNFNGFVFGKFACPLPIATGMNQLDQFCCGYPNYQYCCNAQEYSSMHRGAFADHAPKFKHGISTRTEFSPSTKRILIIMAPIAGFIVLSGIVVLVGLYYRKVRRQQNSFGKPIGATRLEDDYIVLPQDPNIETSTPNQDSL